MQSPDSSSHIEFDDLPSISQRNTRPSAPHSKSGHHYLPQEDEDSHREPPQSLSIWAKISRNKSLNLLILFILCIAIIDVPILGAGVSLYMKQVTFKATMQESSLLKPLQFMSANLKADPILDVQIGVAGPCPVGYQIIKLGIWPEGIAGCLCENGDLYRTSCAEVNSPQCNTELPRSFRTKLYEWKGWFWCAKRAVQGTDFVKKAECPPNYKECYPGGCFLGDCPVTGIVSSSTITRVNESPYGSLILEKAQGKSPLINVQLTLGETPCDIREVESYKASVAKEYECDTYGLNQQVRTRIDEQTAYSSYLDNLFPYSIMRLRSFVGNDNAISSILSSITRMKTANIDYCLDIDEKAINDFLEVIPNKINLACFVLVFLLKLKVIVSIIRALAPNSPTKLFKDSFGLIKTLCVLNIVALTVVIIMLLNLACVYIWFKTAREYFEEYSSLGCFIGGAGDAVVNDYLKILKSANVGSWVHFALLLTKILAGFLCCRIYIMTKAQSYKEIKEPKEKNLKPVSLKTVLSDFE